MEMTPRRLSSSTIRCSSPPCVSERRIWSSHGLVPVAASVDSRRLTFVTAVKIAPWTVEG
jgi:hypothetical protein